ncbi:putative bifunctional diguanylate cyclase/phosphodiesterase [Sulfuriflexus mobilis]|uniref:putative bifunctional diguanylate cyclase/phosphodiesterase n=1 Tax=Sulfuriflexus mobilis TaxID=1811807 RepID=UPI001E3B882C|nr:EAL domain-containing protein [Sulfuriflexus mobilis]
MPINPECKDALRLCSLRRRYLSIAGILAVLLLGGALLANWYANDVSRQNTRGLSLQNQAEELMAEIRNGIWAADSALNAMLLSPEAEHELIIARNMHHAQRKLSALNVIPALHVTGLSDDLKTLEVSFSLLQDKVEYLVEKRRDANWVYPLLPYITERLLEPNQNFETAVQQALNEIAELDGRSYASELYGQFDEAGDLWRKMILDFRAVIIRFAGLNATNEISQETNIESFHTAIVAKLALLQQLHNAGELGFESEQALETMQQATRAWRENWETAKQLRSSKLWRADLEYMSNVIRPNQQLVYEALNALESGVHVWMEKNVELVQAAATTISYILWGLAGLALFFLGLIYLMIERSVLKPIERISKAITEDGEKGQYHLEDYSSQEVNKLVSAFNRMRQQIHQRQMALEDQALHDALTGLPNRALLNDRIEQAIHIMRRNTQPIALLLLDLDRFKEVNDALGHPVGDQLLQHVGQRLKGVLRDSDTVARLGGDEFAIVAPNATAVQASQFAEKIISVINEAFSIEGQDLYVGVSIGVAVYPQHGDDADTLVRHADVAMYHAKRNKLGHSVYKQSQDEGSVDKLTLVSDLHNELDVASAVQLYYQPQVDIVSREIVAIEALLRWEHPQLGYISPEHIVNMAEHTGQIDTLTRWVVNTALRDCAGYLNRYGIRLSVNLSARNLQDSQLPMDIEKALTEYGVKPAAITLEITESAMMNDPVRARMIMSELNAMGIELSVDDFGTGFSSLGYLKMLPVGELKIDKSFVINMLEDENDAIIVHSTIELAHNLGLKVVAEGVESQTTMLQLLKLKCDVAQGYFLSRPIPADELAVWLKEYESRLAS